jgi:hypothetical protein
VEFVTVQAPSRTLWAVFSFIEIALASELRRQMADDVVEKEKAGGNKVLFLKVTE